MSESSITLADLESLESAWETHGAPAILAALEGGASAGAGAPKVASALPPLLRRALLLDRDTLAAEPGALFQVLWNRLHWHDAPECAELYEEIAGAPWTTPGDKLHTLADRWLESRRARGRREPWLRALRPVPGRLEDSGAVFLDGHEAQAICGAFDPTTRFLATGSDDATARIWDLATRRSVHTLVGHEGEIRGIAWSPDGKRVATGSRDHTIRIWDAATGEQRHELQGEEGQTTGVAFSPDGLRLAASNLGWVVHVFDAVTGEARLKLEGHEQSALCVAWSPEGDWLVSGASDDTARVWDSKTGECRQVLEHDGGVDRVLPSPDGRWLATATSHALKVWDTSTWTLVAERSPTTVGRTVTYPLLVGFVWTTPTTLVVLGNGSRATIDLAAGGRVIETAHPVENHGQALAVSSDGRWVVLSRNNLARVTVLDLEAPPALVPRLKNADARLELLGVSRAASRVIFRRDFRALVLLDVRDGRERTLEVDHNSFTLAVIHPGGDLLAWEALEFLDGSVQPGVALLDLRSSQVTRLAFAPVSQTGFGSALAFSPDGSLLASWSGQDRLTRLTDIAHRTSGPVLAGVATREAHASVRTIAWSPRGTYVATGSDDDTVLVWHAASARLALETEATRGRIGSVMSWSADESLCAVGLSDATLRVWSLASRKLAGLYQGFAAPVTAVALSADGLRVAGGSASGEILIWQVGAGADPVRLEGHAQAVTDLAFDGASAPATLISTAGQEGSVRCWDLASGQTTWSAEGVTLPAEVLDSEVGFWALLGRDGTTLHRRASAAKVGYVGVAFAAADVFPGRRLFGVGGDEPGVMHVYELAHA